MKGKLSKQRAYQLRQRAKGLCALCPTPVWRAGSDRCREHLDRHLEAKRERHAKARGIDAMHGRA